MSSQQHCPISSLSLADLLKNLIITHYGEVTSTSDLVRTAALEDAPEGTAFRADIQTSGRGRHGRDWVSPAGNLYMSILLKPQRPMAEWPSLSLMAGLALYDAVAMIRDKARLGLKWPNDVLLDDRKVAGLLIETQDNAVILGCGVNCLHAPTSTAGWQPGWLNQHPNDKETSADDVAEKLAVSLCQRYNDWQQHGFSAIAEGWKSGAAHLGKMIEARQMNNTTYRGIFEDLGPDGSMLLRLDDGQIKAMTAGDVVQVRPEGHNHAVGD